MAAELKKLQEKLGEAGELDPEVVKMKKELEEKKKKEQEFVDELEDLRTKLAEKEEKDADDPYIAQLEAEVSTLKFEKLAMSENFMEMKKEFDVYKEKAEKVQELEERAEQMESFINELQEERNELFEKLQRCVCRCVVVFCFCFYEFYLCSSEQQVLQLGQMLGKVKDEDLVNNEKKLEDEIASLKQQIAQRDDELARQGEVMSGLIKSVEQRTAVSPRNPSAPNTVSAAATATVVLEKEETKNVQKTELKCLKWEQSLSEVFVSLNKGQMERNKERISMQDKKVFKDPMNQVIKGGGQILFLQNNEGEVECCCALVIGVGCYDLKYIAFRDNAPEERKVSILVFLVLYSSDACVRACFWRNAWTKLRNTQSTVAWMSWLRCMLEAEQMRRRSGDLLDLNS